MKKIFIAVVVLLVLLILGFLYASATADRRARFIDTVNSLKEAHFELQKHGAFTNHFQHMNVYPYTNQLTVGGIHYQCEFAVDSEWFNGISFFMAPTNKLGFLTITTNEIYIWVDEKRGPIPLVKPLTFPPGF